MRRGGGGGGPHPIRAGRRQASSRLLRNGYMA
jgi:hypothetical protein